VLLAHLAISNLKQHRVRFALAVCATALSVALVVAVTSGFASLDRMIRGFVLSFVGTVDFEVDGPDGRKPTLPESTLQLLRDDPRIRSAHGRLQRDLHPIREDGGILFEVPNVTLFGIQPEFDSYPRVMTPSHGRWFTAGEKNVVVIDSNLAEKTDLKLGDTLRFGGVNGVMSLKVVGMVKVPSPIAPLFMSCFVPIDTVQRFIDPADPGGYDKLRAEFEVGVDAEAYFAELRPKLAAIHPSIEIESKRKSRERVDQNLRSMRLMSMWMSTVAVLAAAFIIFSTLSMGVAERRRQLAMLRAVGATRGQVAWLVVVEAMALAVAGVVIGLPLGLAAVFLLAELFPGLFVSGVAIDPLGIAYAAISCIVASLLASIWPAWAASRARPLEAMAHQASPAARGWPWKWAVLGLVLVLLDTLMCVVPLNEVGTRLGIDWLARNGRDVAIFVRFLVTIPALMVGLFLIAPMVVFAVERGLGRILARVARVRYELLQQQLSGAVWRAAGTAAALMVGLTVLIAMNMVGRSTLEAWKIPKRFPDVFVFVSSGMDTLTPEQVEDIGRTPGVVPDRVMPIRITIPGLGDNFWQIASWASVPSRTMFVAAPPDRLLAMMDLDFREGDPDTATRMLTDGRRVVLKGGSILHGTIVGNATTAPGTGSIVIHQLDGTRRTISAQDIVSIDIGRYLLVTAELSRVKGIGVGGTIPLERSGVGLTSFEYTIVGVVWSPGVDVIINAFDLPNRVEAQTAYAVFGTIRSVERDFGQFSTRLVAVDLEKGLDHKAVEATLRDKLAKSGLTVVNVREFRDNLLGMFSSILLFLSTIAWAAMLVASLGVGNAIVAAVRTRQWQFGVLRSIGLTGGQLLRLVLAEGLLLGACGVVLGLIGGFVLSTNARLFYAQLLGLDPPLVVPWGIVVLGCVVVLVLSVIMSAWPAWRASRTEPLALLRAGRASS
jgi:putative ABC transport system permease protein